MLLMAVSEEDQVTAELRPGHPTVVTLRGELDILNAERLREVLLLAYAARQPVVIDATEASFVDASIVTVLAQANARCEGCLEVRGAAGSVARMFQVTDMEHLLQGTPS